MASLKEISAGLPVDPLPSPRDRDDSVPHAPVRAVNLTDDERRVWKIRCLTQTRNSPFPP